MLHSDLADIKTFGSRPIDVIVTVFMSCTFLQYGFVYTETCDLLVSINSGKLLWHFISAARDIWTILNYNLFSFGGCLVPFMCILHKLLQVLLTLCVCIYDMYWPRILLEFRGHCKLKYKQNYAFEKLDLYCRYYHSTWKMSKHHIYKPAITPQQQSEWSCIVCHCRGNLSLLLLTCWLSASIPRVSKAQRA